MFISFKFKEIAGQNNNNDSVPNNTIELLEKPQMHQSLPDGAKLNVRNPGEGDEFSYYIDCEKIDLKTLKKILNDFNQKFPDVRVVKSVSLEANPAIIFVNERLQAAKGLVAKVSEAYERYATSRNLMFAVGGLVVAGSLGALAYKSYSKSSN